MFTLPKPKKIRNWIIGSIVGLLVTAALTWIYRSYISPWWWAGPSQSTSNSSGPAQQAPQKTPREIAEEDRKRVEREAALRDAQFRERVTTIQRKWEELKAGVVRLGQKEPKDDWVTVAKNLKGPCYTRSLAYDLIEFQASLEAANPVSADQAAIKLETVRGLKIVASQKWIGVLKVSHAGQPPTDRCESDGEAGKIDLHDRLAVALEIIDILTQTGMKPGIEGVGLTAQKVRDMVGEGLADKIAEWREAMSSGNEKAAQFARRIRSVKKEFNFTNAEFGITAEDETQGLGRKREQN